MNKPGCAVFFLFGLLTGCTDTNAVGTLRADAVVLYRGTEIDAETLARCQAFGECSGVLPINIADVAREGNNVYVLARPGGVVPLLYVSHDLGATWSEHPLPPSYDLVEGVPDGDPGFYVLHAWQGHLYLLVEAITAQARFHYFVPAEVDLTANTYHLRSAHLDSALHVEGGKVLSASTQGGNTGTVSWNIYDFVTDTNLATGNIPLVFGGGYPSAGWTSADGKTLSAVSSDQSAGPVKWCHHTLEPSTGGTSFTTRCMSRARVPITAAEETNTRQVSHAGETWQLTRYRDHALMVGFLERNDAATIVGTIDLGPGMPAIGGAPIERRFGGFFHIASLSGASATTDDSRLVRVTDDGHADEVTLPRSPCQSGGVCGWAGTTKGGYGAVVWLEPLDGGEFLSFSLINQSSQGRRELLVVTRERPTFAPVVTTPIEFGVLPAWPEALPPSPLDLQCERAVACGVHSNLLECKAYWAAVRHGLGGVDTEYAAFIAVPPGSCDYQPAYSNRLLTPRVDGGAPLPCTPGCLGTWATYSCAPYGSMNLSPRKNCAVLGTTCQLDTQGRGYCGAHAMPAGACDTCSGTFANACAGLPMPSVLDCSALGGTCHVQLGQAFCAPAVCSASVRLECHGEVRAACGQGPELPVIEEADCGRLGGSCATPMQCSPQPDDCNAVQTAFVRSGQLCDDGVLLYCDATGAARVLDCRSLGLTHCTQTTSAPNQLLARCLP
jgi:hypothetical protein